MKTTMKIEVGRTYLHVTRATVLILAKHECKAFPNHPFVGVNNTTGAIRRYSASGEGDPNTLDLLSECITPPKFQWLAMNSAGDWWLHVSKPVPGGSFWASSGATCCLGDGIISCESWRKSLHRVLEGGALERVTEESEVGESVAKYVAKENRFEVAPPTDGTHPGNQIKTEEDLVRSVSARYLQKLDGGAK